MTANGTPLRWPAAWAPASHLDLLKDSGIDCLITDRPEVAEAASRAGLKAFRPGRPVPDTAEIEGLWPGIRSSRFGALNAAGAGPTGEPWINTNIWPVRLAQARNPGKSIWVRSAPADPGISAQPHIMAIADAALAGGRWVIDLPDQLAAGIAAGRPDCLTSWRQIARTSAFYAAHPAWSSYTPQAVLGVLSSFSTGASKEALNLITRSGQQYRILLRGVPPDFSGLRAILSPDKEVPTGPERAAILRFVTAGGMLIASPEWGSVPGATKKESSHPRFALYTLGQGSIAIARASLNDPYLLSNDCGILISHRYDILRFWNGGALNAIYSRQESMGKAPAGLVQILFYATQPAVDASLWISGAYTTARLLNFEQTAALTLKADPSRGGIEVRLPGEMRYAAIEVNQE